jgi:nicotinamide-nucleotide amidase
MRASRATKPLRVGLIATGDELTQGDILNTNGQAIARQLHEMGFKLFQHIIVDDDEARIQHAIETLALHNDVVIISGGLGPTSDDRTRYALAAAVKKELVFDEPSWQAIVARLQKAHIDVHESNNQQAWLPSGGDILPNPHGTAPGFHIEHQNTHYFMLPGPPKECLPMFRDQVLPALEGYAQITHHFKWLLLGASEGEIGAQLDAALANIACQTGYRWGYPYLEFKVSADSNQDLLAAEAAVLPLLTDYLVSKHNISLEQQLYSMLEAKNLQLHFADNTTSQRVMQTLLTANVATLFSETPANAIQISLSGFKEYWQNLAPPCLTQVSLSINHAGKKSQQALRVYYRDDTVWTSLSAQVCREVLAFLSSENLA